MRPTDRTAAELIAAQGQGESAESIATAFVSAIRECDPGLHAFLHVDEAGAREQARAVDRKRKSGAPLGPLAGVPVALKDVLCTRGMPTTCGSRILEHYKPPYDAGVVERL